MEYPSGHHSHHRREGRDEDYPPPPPPFDPSRPHPPPPPPSQVAHVFHEGPPRPPDYYHQPPPPPAIAVQHVSHKSETNPQHHLPHLIHHNTHQPGSELAEKPSLRVFSKAEKNYSLTIRHGKVILAPSDPSDRFQHWIKDEKYSTRVKDEQGYPSFALVNKGSGQAMKHSIGATHPVQLIPYKPDVLDESILWTESKDLGDGFRTIRMVNNIRLNVDAFNGDKNHGGVHDGTTIVLWEWKKGDNQRWKIVPYCKSLEHISV